MTRAQQSHPDWSKADEIPLWDATTYAVAPGYRREGPIRALDWNGRAATMADAAKRADNARRHASSVLAGVNKVGPSTGGGRPAKTIVTANSTDSFIESMRLSSALLNVYGMVRQAVPLPADVVSAEQVAEMSEAALRLAMQRCGAALRPGSVVLTIEVIGTSTEGSTRVVETSLNYSSSERLEVRSLERDETLDEVIVVAALSRVLRFDESAKHQYAIDIPTSATLRASMKAQLSRVREDDATTVKRVMRSLGIRT